MVDMASDSSCYGLLKDSDVESLGVIPQHWKISRFRNLFSFNKGLTITKDDLQDTGIPCINYGDVHSRYGFEVNPDNNPLKCVREEFIKDNPGSLLRAGDFIFADTSEDIEGSGNFSQLTGGELVFAGYHTIIARPIGSGAKRYLAYMLDSVAFRDQIRRAVKGVKVYSITQSILKNPSVWLPPIAEQELIAGYLDRKLVDVSQAIQIKECQIERFKERKQILIQQAVTRGLDPYAPMCDSGIEWIGEIPAHWRVIANRALFRERVEPGREDLPLLSVSIHSGVSEEEISEEENIRGRVKIEDKTKYIRVRPGDIAFNMMRAWQGAIGAVRVDGMVSPAYTIAVPRPCLDARYFEYQYRTPGFIQQMDRYSKGITDFRKRLYWDGFKQLISLVPPIEEQLAIVELIEHAILKQNAAVALLELQISKLKEYRATLINSAVTGKIKVPGVVEPELRNMEVG